MLGVLGIIEVENRLERVFFWVFYRELFNWYFDFRFIKFLELLDSKFLVMFGI